jgi:hypothetical protein
MLHILDSRLLRIDIDPGGCLGIDTLHIEAPIAPDDGRGGILRVVVVHVPRRHIACDHLRSHGPFSVGGYRRVPSATHDVPQIRNQFWVSQQRLSDLQSESGATILVLWIVSQVLDGSLDRSVRLASPKESPQQLGTHPDRRLRGCVHHLASGLFQHRASIGLGGRPDVGNNGGSYLSNLSQIHACDCSATHRHARPNESLTTPGPGSRTRLTAAGHQLGPVTVGPRCLEGGTSAPKAEPFAHKSAHISTSEALSRMGTGPLTCTFVVAGTGFEPATSGL